MANTPNPIKTLTVAGSTYNIHAFEADHATKATQDANGKVITTYIASVEVDGSDDKKVLAKSGAGTTHDTVQGSISATYTAATMDLAIDTHVHFTHS